MTSELLLVCNSGPKIWPAHIGFDALIHLLCNEGLFYDVLNVRDTETIQLCILLRFRDRAIELLLIQCPPLIARPLRTALQVSCIDVTHNGMIKLCFEQGGKGI